MNEGVVAVIVAAGAGRRMAPGNERGVAKALLTHSAGDTFLGAIAESAKRVGCARRLVVVAEPHRLVTTREARRYGLEVVVNDDPSRGMASSVAVAFSRLLELERDLDSSNVAPRLALLWPVDHANMDPDTVQRLLDEARVAGPSKPIVVPTHDGRGGHPTLFRHCVWPELARCDGARDGARAVVRADRTRVLRVPVDDIGVVRDVDTPEDLR